MNPERWDEMRTYGMRRMCAAVAVGLAATLAACGGTELLSGGQNGTVTAVATDDEGASAARGPTTSPSLSRSPSSAAPSGTLEFAAAVSVVEEDGRVVPITDGFATGQLRMDSPDVVILGEERVPAGLYTRARVTFARVSAEVTGGLVVGGIPLGGLIRVGIGAEPLVVEAPILLRVEADGESTLVVDLNAGAWLASVDPLTRTVPVAAFRTAVAVRAR